MSKISAPFILIVKRLNLYLNNKEIELKPAFAKQKIKSSILRMKLNMILIIFSNMKGYGY